MFSFVIWGELCATGHFSSSYCAVDHPGLSYRVQIEGGQNESILCTGLDQFRADFFLQFKSLSIAGYKTIPRLWRETIWKVKEIKFYPLTFVTANFYRKCSKRETRRLLNVNRTPHSRCKKKLCAM